MITTIGELFEKHPRPWAVHKEYPRPGSGADDDGVIMDANGCRVLWSSEWFNCAEGVVERIVEVINAA